MTKILLTAVDAKFIHSNLAIYDLATYAYKYHDNVKLKEYTINQQKDYILRDLYLETPDIICFSCYIWNIDFIKELISSLSKVLPNTKIWLGGPEVTYNAAETLESLESVAGVMIGEGEETFLELCDYYISGKGNLASINGLAYRESLAISGKELETLQLENSDFSAESLNTSAVLTRPRDIFDLNKLPFCYETLNNLTLEHRIIYYESSRGCPFNCSYCLSSVDKKVRFRDLSMVFHELQYFIDHEVPQVKFVDRTFNCDHKRTMAIWQYLIDHDKGITNFHCEIAAEVLNQEEIELLKTMRPGLVQLEIGVQTTNTTTLKAIHRPSTFENLANIVNDIHTNRNVHMHLDLIVGLPNEDIKSFSNSFNDVYSLYPEQLQMGFLKVLKGSFMAMHKDDYDCVYQTKAPFEVLSTRWISYGDVLLLKQVEDMVEVYYNSVQFTKSLPYIINAFNTPFEFFKAIGEFYAYKGYDRISHNRIRRYEILLEFAKFVLEFNESCETEKAIFEKYGAYNNNWGGPSVDALDKNKLNIEKLTELLTLDLYLRENLKKRPVWMRNLDESKKEIRKFCGNHNYKLSAKLHFEIFSHIDKSDIISANSKCFDLNAEEKFSDGENDLYCLFDYENRSLIDHNARELIFE